MCCGPIYIEYPGIPCPSLVAWKKRESARWSNHDRSSRPVDTEDRTANHVPDRQSSEIHKRIRLWSLDTIPIIHRDTLDD